MRWFAEPDADDGTLTVCRMKNGFALADGEALDGYRDLKVRACLRIFEGNRKGNCKLPLSSMKEPQLFNELLVHV